MALPAELKRKLRDAAARRMEVNRWGDWQESGPGHIISVPSICPKTDALQKHAAYRHQRKLKEGNPMVTMRATRILIMFLIAIMMLVPACHSAQRTLTTSVSPSGGGTVTPAGGTYDDDTELKLSATPASGYAFDYWTGDATGTSSSITMIMDSDKSVNAHFKEQYTLTTSVSPSDSGTVTPASGSYDYGTHVKLTAYPKSDYLFDHWSGDATGNSALVTITMDNRKEVVAHFAHVKLFSQVFRGGGIPQAAAYQGNQHPVVLLDSKGNEHDWSDNVPIQWLSTVVEETQLVVLIGNENKKAIEICQYAGPDITRYQYSLDVVLREAKTGKIVAKTTLFGSKPRACMQTEVYSLTKLEGSHVSFDQVYEWLREYVEL